MSENNETVNWRDKYEELEKEYEEFRENSHMYEKELEQSLEQTEQSNKEYKLKNNRLQQELETQREKSEQSQKELLAQLIQLQEELEHMRQDEEERKRYIVELEQVNDDLERAQRVLMATQDDCDGKLNAEIERNALLECELDEKEQLIILVQRLKDEIRDLKQEVQVLERQKVPKIEKLQENRHRLMKVEESNEKRLSNSNSPLKSLNQTPHLSPLTRTSAMDIVGDLLRKVGALESKMALCRSCKDSNIPNEGIRENHRNKPLNREISSPTINSPVRN